MDAIFTSDRYFTMFDIVVSHGLLLLRSSINEQLTHNVDVIFFGTAYIQSFTMLRGVRIRKIANNDNIVNYPTVKKELDYSYNHLFEVESNNEKYYIVASFVKVFENQLDFLESSLGRTVDKGREIANSFET
jgi:hypothetical protein